jgi:hypothetical protein
LVQPQQNGALSALLTYATMLKTHAPHPQTNPTIKRVRRAYKPDFVQCTALDVHIDDHSS